MSQSAAKRVLTELRNFAASGNDSVFVEALAPTSHDNVLELAAILSGRALPKSTGYTGGRWRLAIAVPIGYPNVPPRLRFVTKVCHANVSWDTGAICLDLLRQRWTPVLGLVAALECVGRLLADAATDSPLGLEVAALERNGDLVAKRALVTYWCAEERWEGDLDDIEPCPQPHHFS
ncbi:Bgt-1727 [Blumeria graminis f. sp. tritici]|uniref:Bgt-1727 n=2 Tax=Blumeria graminis f. sp. tritici TaxID=62690 RepID=A0A061HKK4_BLUGR|nr:Peroxisomal ubiquitin conjugating enzyme [Blumeria graminis f. sp. tritici 96224]VDB90552.1 Bgt-1727 [Blumeria graminis f. sp. tritici]